MARRFPATSFSTMRRLVRQYMDGSGSGAGHFQAFQDCQVLEDGTALEAEHAQLFFVRFSFLESPSLSRALSPPSNADFLLTRRDEYYCVMSWKLNTNGV